MTRSPSKLLDSSRKPEDPNPVVVNQLKVDLQIQLQVKPVPKNPESRRKVTLELTPKPPLVPERREESLKDPRTPPLRKKLLRRKMPIEHLKLKLPTRNLRRVKPSALRESSSLPPV